MEAVISKRVEGDSWRGFNCSECGEVRKIMAQMNQGIFCKSCLMSGLEVIDEAYQKMDQDKRPDHGRTDTDQS